MAPADLEARRLAELKYCQQQLQLQKGPAPAKQGGPAGGQYYKLLSPEEEDILQDLLREMKDMKIRSEQIEANNKRLEKKMVEAQDLAWAEIDKRNKALEAKHEERFCDMKVWGE